MMLGIQVDKLNDFLKMKNQYTKTIATKLMIPVGVLWAIVGMIMAIFFYTRGILRAGRFALSTYVIHYGPLS